MTKKLLTETKKQGLVLSAYGGFYQVLADDAEYQCRLRGKLKRHRAKDDGTGGVYAGDQVIISLPPNGNTDAEGMVEEVLERHNFLPRPRIANISQAVAVLAVREPVYDLLLLDRIMVTAAFYGLKPAICFNKADLAGPDLEIVVRLYQSCGFKVVKASATAEQGLAEFYELLQGEVSVLAGPSGVGKSSLLNALIPGLEIPTGAISERLQRGKHTTRHVRLWQLGNAGLVADAPGFSLLDLPVDLKANQLPDLYPDYRALAGQCRFLGCYHKDEPDCAVKASLAAGQLDAERYERYCRLLSELTEREPVYQKPEGKGHLVVRD